ncbi:uncharacterized protein LOC105185793 [Harpegnathos saltator]|uniref:Silk fibroin n=1 Tax=Harpegnathos saltator TaxID=610380 RepID=E2BRI0_HARSA|nr:uncharacterized protein LOC105185793 [Harpegnathos saltator]EFN81672.1 hypothetical protein EAI_14300 [Harpegnathos saltator]
MKIPAILVTSLITWGLASGDHFGSKSGASASASASASAKADSKDMRILVPLLKKGEHHKDMKIDKSVFNINKVVLGAVGKINGAPKLGLGWKEVSIGLENAKASANAAAETLASIKKTTSYYDQAYMNIAKVAAEASAKALAITKMALETQKIAEAKGEAASQALAKATVSSRRAEAAAAATKDAVDRTIENVKAANSAQTYANGQAENANRNAAAMLATLIHMEESAAMNNKAATASTASAAAASALHAKANAVLQTDVNAASMAAMSAEEAGAAQASALRSQQLAAAILEKASADQQAASAKADYDASTTEARAAAQASAINALRDGIVVGLGNDNGASAQEIAQAIALARAGHNEYKGHKGHNEYKGHKGHKGYEGHKMFVKKGMYLHGIEEASAEASASASAEASSRIMKKKW